MLFVAFYLKFCQSTAGFMRPANITQAYTWYENLWNRQLLFSHKGTFI